MGIFPNNIKNKEAVETDGYAHLFYDRDEKLEAYTNSAMVNFNLHIERHLGITAQDIIRSRASVKHPKLGYTVENYNLPHVDYFTPHLSLIYYINDSDGATRVFNEKFTPVPSGNNLGINEPDYLYYVLFSISICSSSSETGVWQHFTFPAFSALLHKSHNKKQEILSEF